MWMVWGDTKPGWGPVFVSLGVFLTDFWDGRIARYLNVASPAGAWLDVTGDFVYIFAGLLALWSNGWVAVWFLGIVAMKFAEFIITSRWHTQRTRQPVMDPAGRFIAGLMYLMPVMVYLTVGIMGVNPGLLIQGQGILAIMIILASGLRYRELFCRR
jgi:CDP-diacylglycerol--glycerol-3-phosphate 3-phosphatidyltransferase